MSLGSETDIDVAPGTPVRAIVAAARGWGLRLGPAVWCGDVQLDPLHPAGVWPLLEGARVGAEPSAPCAPLRGPGLAVIAGPDAGGLVALGEQGVVVGRGAVAGLRIADPHASRTHVAVATHPHLSASDSGSTNGTLRWRDGRASVVGRRRRLRFGDIIEVGQSLVAIVGPVSSAPPPVAGRGTAEAPGGSISSRLAPLASSLAGGLVLALITGRWYLAIVGLMYPAIALWPLLSHRLPRRRQPWDLDLLPTPLAATRRGWSEAGIGCLAISGPLDAAHGFARALVLAIGRRPSGDRWAEPWMRWLPSAQPGDPTFEFPGTDVPPSWCDAIVDIAASGCTFRRAGVVRSLPSLDVAPETAESSARAIAGAAEGSSLPRRVGWADLPPPPASQAPRGPGGPRSLVARVGVGRRGTFTLDLDVHGPHILVAGTTGSGKSSLLETLVLGLSAEFSPSDLSLALIDFKGGAGVRTCVALPHVRGVLTDLDPHLARRALTALASEIEDRKAALAEVGLPSFQAWEAAGGAPPRLLVIADEYQELVAHYREFVPDLARIAAQGRSLGLHLVLATQRPAGAVTAEVRANVATTVALRVASEAESRDLIGTPDASSLPLDAPGRAIVATGADRTQVQVAVPCLLPSPPVRRWGEADAQGGAAHLADHIIERWAEQPRPAPLWLPPLPADLGVDSLPPREPGIDSPGIWLGRGDLPAERRQPDVYWDPRSGPLVVAGPARSGRTSTLRLVALQGRRYGLRPVWLPQDPREAARTVFLAARSPDVLLIIDDAPRALAALADVDRGAPVDALTALVESEGSVAIAMPLSGPHRIASHAQTRLVLAGGDATDEATWGIPRALHGLATLPGRGRLWVGGRWSECQSGWSERTEGEPLVRSLPVALDTEGLSGSLGREGETTGGDGTWFPVGVGGDDARVIRVDSRRPVAVIGPPGAARDAAAASIRASAARAGATLEVSEADAPFALGAGISRATLVVAEPTPRTARDACRGDIEGLVDPRPPLGRVLIVVDGEATTAQLVRP